MYKSDFSIKPVSLKNEINKMAFFSKFFNHLCDILCFFSLSIVNQNEKELKITNLLHF